MNVLDFQKMKNEGRKISMVTCYDYSAARKVTDLLNIPTIVIGAGASVSGQVLVYQDVLGLNPGFRLKFLRSYADMFGMIQTALNAKSSPPRHRYRIFTLRERGSFWPVRLLLSSL